MPLTQTINVKNQFTAAGYTYDAPGNVLADGSGIISCGGSAYTWNAEEQMSCAAGSTYLYDGDGIRVGKSGGAATPTLYWGAGTLVESDTSGNVTSEYIFLGGRRIARRDVSTGSVYYYFADALGSSNVVATAAGAIENESDFYPFGGESPVSDGLTNQHYKFEGKERDAGTSSTSQPQGLDYFGARFDSSATGRFMSPDWANSPEPVPYSKLGNPQTLNLYAFALNNPESAPDLDGHEDAAESVASMGAGGVGQETDSTEAFNQRFEADKAAGLSTGISFAFGSNGSGTASSSGSPNGHSVTQSQLKDVANQIEHFDAIVSAKIARIIKAVQSGNFILASDVAENAQAYLNAGGDYEGKSLALRNLEDIIGSELVKSIQNEVGSILSRSTEDQKLIFLGMITHQDKLNAPSRGSNLAHSITDWSIDRIPIIGTFVRFMLENASNNAKKAHDNSIDQIQNSLGSKE